MLLNGIVQIDDVSSFVVDNRRLIDVAKSTRIISSQAIRNSSALMQLIHSPIVH